MNQLQYLRQLARGAGQRHPDAAASLKKELEPYVCRIVKRVLRTGRASSGFAEKILAEARLLSGRETPKGDAARIALVTETICASIIIRLQYSPRLWTEICDTVVG